MKAGNTSSFQNFEEYISTDQSTRGFPDARPSPVKSAYRKVGASNRQEHLLCKLSASAI